MNTVSGIIAIVILVLVVVALIDAASRPAWAWERAGQNKTLWIVLLVVGIPCGLIGLVAAVVYATTAAAWAEAQPSAALEATWRLIRETNSLLEEAEPWKLDPGPAVDAVLGDALEALRIVAILASPAVPAASAEVWRRIGLAGSPLDQRLPGAAAWGGYPGGLAVTKGAPLFPRLTATP